MYATLDIETPKWSESNLELKITFGYICYFQDNRARKVRFYTPSQLFTSIEAFYYKFKKSYLIFTHNLDFDYKFLMQYVLENYESSVMDNGNMFSIKIYKKIKDKKVKICEFRNSLRLFPMKLKDLGSAIKLAKIEQDYDESESEKYHKYCIRDNYIIMKALKYLVKFFNDLTYPLEIEKMNLSFPSIAYKVFHYFNSEFNYTDEKSRTKNQLTNIANWINDYFREFYFGGRTEVLDFNIFREVAYLDFNSLYTYIMTGLKFPKPKYWKVKDYRTTENTFAIFCEIDESEENIPIIASKLNGKLVFLASKKESLLTIEEYNYISSNRPNTRIIIKERWECDGWITPFNYMKDLYEKRVRFKKQGNPFELFIKLLLNSTYGKFAERPEKTSVEFYDVTKITKDFAKEKLSKAKTHKFVGNTLIIYNEFKVPRMNINVPFAHRITANARLELVKMIDKLNKLGIKVIYCDTDSVVIDTSKLREVKTILSKSELGKLKIEKIYAGFCALAPKEYLFVEKFEFKQKAKGLSDCSLYDYYFNEVQFVRPIKYREAIKRNIDFKNAIIVKKHKNTFYDKRIINNDFTTKPIKTLDDITETNKSLILEQITKYFNR